MANISQVIEHLEALKEKHGEVEVLIVNYHSDYHDDPIKVLENAIRFDYNCVVIGGESY